MTTQDPDVDAPVVSDGIQIGSAHGEIVVGGRPNPRLTPAAARETARRLIEAADMLQRSSAV